jgi:hypothetical protein
MRTELTTTAANARTIAEMYRRRWTIGTAFQEMEKTLKGEIKELGYPKAALFSFCVALLSYNVMSTLKAALRAAHGAEESATVSGFYLADEVKMNHRGMLRAIPTDEWVDGTPVGVPQESPRPEETEAQETKRGEDQSCRHCQDIEGSESVYIVHVSRVGPEPSPFGGIILYTYDALRESSRWPRV